jgi:hypothetical protein
MADFLVVSRSNICSLIAYNEGGMRQRDFAQTTSGMGAESYIQPRLHNITHVALTPCNVTNCLREADDYATLAITFDVQINFHPPDEMLSIAYSCSNSQRAGPALVLV